MNKANYSETFQKFGTNFIQHFGQITQIWEKLFRNLGEIIQDFGRNSEIQKFRNYSEIIQKLFRNYSETISEIIRRKIFLEGKLFLGGKTSF